jgi:hypothetical protein
MLCPIDDEEERISKLWGEGVRESMQLSSPNKAKSLSGDDTGAGFPFDSYEEPIFSAAFPDDAVPADDTDTTVANHHDYHSMLLLGGYVDENGKHWFLLWKNWPLVLVSTSYLMACQASFAFLSNPIGQAPNYAHNLDPTTECSFRDLCDRKEAPRRKEPIFERVPSKQ